MVSSADADGTQISICVHLRHLRINSRRISEEKDMSDKKIIAVVGATGAQGGGLVRAITSDPDGPFVARAITRDVNSDKALALAALGAEVVAGGVGGGGRVRRAVGGADGADCGTFFLEHFSPATPVGAGRASA